MNIDLKNIESARDAVVARVKDLPNTVTKFQQKVQSKVTQLDLKGFAPIDLPALQARTRDLQDKLVEIPTLIQGFVQELPDSATRIANDLPGTANKLVADAKERTSALQSKLTGFGRTTGKGKKTAKKASSKKTSAAKKTTAKKSTPKKTTARKTSTKKTTPSVPAVDLAGPANGNGISSGSVHAS